MKKIVTILTLATCLIPFLASAQSFEDYLALRKKFNITKATDVETIDSIVGKQVMEIKGVVQGTVGSGESELLIVVGPDGDQHFVHSADTPGWLKNGSVNVRLLVNAERATEHSLLYINLISAATESDVAAYEAKATKKAPPSTPLKGRIGGSKTSRSGGRPAPIPGDIPKVTTNNIGEPQPGLSESLSAVLPTYVAFIKNRNKKLTDEQAQRIAQSILAYSAHFGVDPRLIVAIVIAESDFNPNETSRPGAQGLGQLMPVNVKELGLTDGYNIEQNLWGTVKLVRGHIDKYNSKTEDSFEALVLALAGYNAGDGAVKKYGGVPPYKETQNYVRKVIAIYQQLVGK